MALKAMRLSARKTRREVAQVIGCTEGSLRNWEHGHAKPGSGYLLKLLNYYRITLRRPRLEVAELLDNRRESK